MTAPFNKTPILFAALLTVATPAFAGDLWTIPGGLRFGTDGECTLFKQNVECVDAAGNFFASYSGGTEASRHHTLSQPHLADIAADPRLTDKRLANFRHFVLDYIKRSPVNKNLGELQLNLKQVGSMWAFVATFKSDDRQGDTTDTVLVETWYDGRIIKIVANRPDTDAAVTAVYNSLQTLKPITHAYSGIDNFQTTWLETPNALAVWADNCNSLYKETCVPLAIDVDCAGQGGNGPKYVSGPFRYEGSDRYRLDGNKNGIACELHEDF